MINIKELTSNFDFIVMIETIELQCSAALSVNAVICLDTINQSRS